MTINVVRQDVGIRCEEYFFHAEEDRWDIVYSAFIYLSKEDKPKGAVDEKLDIEITYPDKFGRFKDSTGSFSERIDLCNSKITLRAGSLLAKERSFW